MNKRNSDFFYEGKIVPTTLKNSIYKMEDRNAHKNVHGNGRSVFENVMTGLLEEFMCKKNISLVKIEKFVNEKAKNIKTYVMHFENDKGEQFKCSCFGEKNSIPLGATHMLATSIIFTFAEYGCKICNYKERDCEFCDRTKIEKIFPSENKCTIKHNMKEFIKVFGKDSVKSIKDFCEGYYEYIREESSVKDENYINDYVQKQSLPPEIQEVIEIDPNVIQYIIKIVTTVLGEYANNNKDIRNIMFEYQNVEKSFLAAIQQLQKYYHFVKMIKENPNDIPEEVMENLREKHDEDDDLDDEDDDDEGESWKEDIDDA
jgi:hypothetical protein